MSGFGFSKTPKESAYEPASQSLQQGISEDVFENPNPATPVTIYGVYMPECVQLCITAQEHLLCKIEPCNFMPVMSNLWFATGRQFYCVKMNCEVFLPVMQTCRQCGNARFFWQNISEKGAAPVEMRLLCFLSRGILIFSKSFPPASSQPNYALNNSVVFSDSFISRKNGIFTYRTSSFMMRYNNSARRRATATIAFFLLFDYSIVMY